jgi:hypothetical protein
VQSVPPFGKSKLDLTIPHTKIRIFSGTLLSPIVFKALGYYGNYLINLTSSICGLSFLIWRVNEPIVKKEPKTFKNCLSFIDNFTVQPVKAMFKVGILRASHKISDSKPKIC